MYAPEGLFNEVLEEDDVMEALASCQDTRRQLREKQKGRQYYAPKQHPKGKGKSKFGSFHPSYGGGKSKSGFGNQRQAASSSSETRKLHIEQLKLRTRCRNCGEVGHWSKECRNRPSQGASGSGSVASRFTARTSFYWTSPDAGNDVKKAFLVQGQCSCSSPQGTDMPEETAAEIPLIGVTTSPQLGLVDTAAQEGLIGREALLRLAEELRGHGLRIKWTGKSSRARGIRGIGGTATTVGVCELPIGLGGVSGVLEVTVIAQDAPLLLPISPLRSLGAVIDLNTDEMQLVRAGSHGKLKTLPSGHSAVSVLDWGESWVFPPACVGKRVESDFRPEASTSKHSFQSNPGSKKVRFNASGPTPSSTYACISSAQSRDEGIGHGRVFSGILKFYFWIKVPNFLQNSVIVQQRSAW